MNQLPLLAGCAALLQREPDIARSREAVALMVDAVRAAAVDAGNEAILQRVQRIYVPKGMWGYSDPARLVAEAIGAPAATTVLAEIGILQQTLVGDACARIARGEIDCAVVVGGEAKYRSLQAAIQQVPCPETAQQATPDETMLPDAELWLEAETQAGLLMPVGFYAIIDSALRHARGETVAAHRDRIARRYVRMSEVAAQNPLAWKRDVLTLEQVRDAVGKNRMLAFPYTKAHNSEWNVDQAAALVLCSEALADELGIAAAQRVYPLVSSESNHMLCLSQRAQLHRAPGAELALQAALEHTGLTQERIGLLDLYSCFPSAVQVFADALGVEDARDITVTGGMAQAGGPLNNYVLQATVRMAQLLREKSSSQTTANGLVSSVSGMLTKQAYGLWSAVKPQRPFAFLDVTEQVRAHSPAKTVLDSYTGPATIAGYTVLYQGDAPARGIAITDTPAGERVVACSEEAATLQRLLGDEWCGSVIRVDGNRFTLAG